MRFRLFLLVSLLVVLPSVAAACGGGGDDDGATAGHEPTPTPQANLPDETALAESMLLTVSDFPSGWAENPSEDDDEPSPFDQCPTLRGSPEVTGQAETGDFDRGDLASVSQIIGLFIDEEAAASGAGVVQQAAQCFVDVLNSGDLDDDEASFSDASLGQVSFNRGGFDESVAMRVSATIRAKEDDIEVRVFFDIVYRRNGRVVSELIAYDAFSPFDITLLEQLSTIAADRIAAADVQPLEE